MSKTILRLVGRFILLVWTCTMTGCVATKQLPVYSSEQNKGNINVTFECKANTNVITVSTSDPVALRTLIMQGYTLELRGNYAYQIKIPSAKDVEDKLKHHPGEVKATMQPGSADEKRPDIRPVLLALNQTKAYIHYGDGQTNAVKSFKTSLIQESGTLVYEITLPKTFSMQPPVEITLISEPGTNVDEFQNGNFSHRNESERPQPFGVGQRPGADQQNRKITVKYNFD